MAALILDGHLKSALASVRSLGEMGVTVVVGAERGSAMALHSRYTDEQFVYTSPQQDQSQFVAQIAMQAQSILQKTGKKPVVYCFSDATYLSLARVCQELSNVLLFPLPSPESIEIAFDKQRTYELAQQYNIPTIRCYESQQFSEVSFPAVVKNRHSMVWKAGVGVSGSADFVFSENELRTYTNVVTKKTGEVPLVQACITGDEYGVELLCNNGIEVAQFSHKRVRSLSPRGGAAVVKETAPASASVNIMQRYAQTLAHVLQWTGPMMVEFKIDNRDGSVKLMEINGRFWGSLPLATRAGVDFSGLYYQLATGVLPDGPVDRPAAHVRTRHFTGDAKWLLSVLFAHDRLREMLYPTATVAIVDFATESFKSTDDVFSWSDIMPSMWEYIDILKR